MTSSCWSPFAKAFLPFLKFRSETKLSFFTRSYQFGGEHADYNSGHVFRRLFPWELMGRLANVTTKFCCSQPTLRDKDCHRNCLLLTSQFEKEHSWTHPKVFFISFKKWRACDWQGLIFMFMGISQMVQACLHQHLWNSWLVLWRKYLFDLKLDRLDLVKIGEANRKPLSESALVSWTCCYRYKGWPTCTSIPIPWSTIWCHDLKDNVVVIMNTNKRRELADSKYNELAVLWAKKGCGRILPSCLGYSDLRWVDR